jgi:hypothetical protein
MPPKPRLNQKKTQAGIVGAGGGTILLAYVSSFEDSNPWKKILLYAAPSVSVAASFLYNFCVHEFNNWNNQRKLRAEQIELKKLASESLSDPHTSAEHKTLIRKQLEESQKLNIDYRLKKIKSHYDENDKADVETKAL